MATGYVGRHRASERSGAGSVGSAPGLRPLRRAGAGLALAGASVAGYLVVQAGTTPNMTQTGATLAVDAFPAAPGLDVAAAEADLADATRAANVRTAAYQTRVSAEQAAAAAALAAAEAQRQAEADRAARDAERASALANAQKDPKGVAKVLVSDMGWDDSQYQCVVKLWTKESNWTYTATNRSSGAYGIPQSLPGSKMGTVAADWRTNPVTQITWGLQYIKGVYGTPCGAWSHSQSHNWY
jgi:hypothetical protein